MSDYEKNGYELFRGIISLEYINEIRRKMLQILSSYSPDSQDIDTGFEEITNKSATLRGNVYKVFGSLADIPLVLAQPSVKEKLSELGFNNYTMQDPSIVCMEPNNNNYLFLPHQDLKQRQSLKSTLLWIPLSEGENIGGVGFRSGSHKYGPIKHDLSETGHLIINDEIIESHPCHNILDYKLGDCLFFDSYIVHWSVGNSGKKMRWTAIFRIDEVSDTNWLNKSLAPFDASSYIDQRSNEERLKEAAEKSKIELSSSVMGKKRR